MGTGILARVPAVAVVVVVAVLATATLTLAATSAAPAAEPVPEPGAAPAGPELATLVVPDVRRQVFVFAKGALEGSGFAWKVRGAVQGFAVNVVVSQAPAPGTRVIADGAPIVTLGLARNPRYRQEGVPENASPYAGTRVRLVGVKKASAPARERVSSAPRPSAKGRPSRKPAFAVAGVPTEPLDEIPLVERATRLSAWLERHKTRTPAAVRHWLYQHNWIVTGASFGWSGGAEALQTLIVVDRRVQELWGIGLRSEQRARRTLARVRAQ